MRLTLKDKVAQMRLIDDIFFEVLATKKPACQEMLRTIMEDPDLIVKSVQVQYNKKNIYGSSVRLDALCSLGNGTNVNVEVQRPQKESLFRRSLFNASNITKADSNTGGATNEILEQYIVYISEFDFLKGGKTIYHIDKAIRETGQVVDDGLHEIFVNTVIDDGSDIADLMLNLLKREIKDPKFPVLTEEVARLKHTEAGLRSVRKVMLHYEELAKAEGKAEERAAIRERMIALGMSLADIDAILA